MLVLLSLLISSISCQTVFWTNGKFSTERTDSVLTGKELYLGCSKTDVPVWGECQWVTPTGDTWYVSNGTVTDDDGNVVDGVVGQGGSQNCSVVIAEVMEDHLGDWRCRYLVEDIKYELIITTESLVTDIRLPQLFDVQHYNILLIPDYSSIPVTHIKFEGYSEMYVVPLENTAILTFHADEITPMKINVNHGNKTDTVTEVHFDFQRTFVHVKVEGGFAAGEGYTVHVDFAADIHRSGFYTTYGFYPQFCTENNDDPTKMCWFTQMQQTYARTAFPCFDEPSFKSRWNIQIARPADYHTKSNAPLLESTPFPDKPGFVLDIFDSIGPPMSSYLVAAAITDYATLPSPDNFTSVWAPKQDIDANRGNFANVIGPELMNFYENHFNTVYPLKKQDLMYAANKLGAMENWGLVLFSRDTLMLDTDASDSEKWRVINVVAHELAHQWFGNLVTVEWWGQTWLNEGFAQFISYIGSEHVDPTPTLHPWARFYVDEMQSVMLSDQNSTSHWPMTDETTDRKDIRRMFGEFTYLKGASVIRMFQSMISEPTFTRGLINYLQDMKYGSVTEDDLFFHLEAAALEDEKWPATNRPFSDVMKSWTNQAGLPIVHASLSNDGKLYLNQTWLVNSGKPADQRLWHVPITLTSVEESPVLGWDATEPYTWLWQDQIEKEVDISEVIPDGIPFIVNVQGTGYYRVNYDESNWVNLADILSANMDLIHPLNRAQIICDISALFDTGHVSLTTRDMILAYIENDTDFLPLYAFQECTGNDPFKSSRIKNHRGFSK